eukprot:m.411997 g.411997  ORF g.411997 m.411997 type:complete len:98 (+) comp20168_c0_seq13:211-504(+)
MRFLSWCARAVVSLTKLVLVVVVGAEAGKKVDAKIIERVVAEREAEPWAGITNPKLYNTNDICTYKPTKGTKKGEMRGFSLCVCPSCCVLRAGWRLT